MECIGKRTIFLRELRGKELGWVTGETKEIGLLDGDW